MKRFRIRELYNERYREYIVGSAETGRHGVYLVYGEVMAGEEREMAPGGHDEILFLLEGEAVLRNGQSQTAMNRDDAVSLDPDESLTFVATSNCRYVVAGTHITPHSH